MQSYYHFHITDIVTVGYVCLGKHGHTLWHLCAVLFLIICCKGNIENCNILLVIRTLLGHERLPFFNHMIKFCSGSGARYCIIASYISIGA